MQDIAKIQAKLFPYSIGVYFDAHTEDIIRDLWARLASAGADYLHATGQRPHITLGIYKDLDLELTDKMLTQISRETTIIPLSFQ